jgi:DNA-binding response OmpR family regulator
VRRDVSAPTLQPPLSRLTVLPVNVLQSHAVDEPAVQLGVGTALRTVEPVYARTIARRVLEACEADVVLLDARGSRPTLAYRAIVRLRNAGWERGIVMLIDRDGIGLVPVASSVGATDFVIAGATGDEIEARLRRAAGRQPSERPRAADDASGIQVHWRTHRVSFEGTSIVLTHGELQLLSVFMDRAGEVLTAKDLARQAWGKARKPGGALTATFVCSLRKKLAWFGGRFGIQTVRGVGYRFIL